MFFLGLLSTPLPYLLLAAFYFFGFAMGLFNSKSDEEVSETAVTVTIPAEIKEEKPDTGVFYFQVNPKINHDQIVDSQLTVQPKTYPPGIPQEVFRDRHVKIREFFPDGFRFSRPPPFIYQS